MTFYSINTVQDIRSYFKFLLESGMFKKDKSGVKMLEIIGASFEANENSIFGKPNEYIKRELEWYKSMSRDVQDIPGKTPAIWEKVADKDGIINSNYGWCIYSPENYSQYFKVLNALEENINSRQAVMIYQRPSMHEDAYENGRSDFICTNAHQYVWNSQEEELECVVQMRSNDVVFGYRNDLAWADHVHKDLCADLGVEQGPITWQVGSLHVYERHFYLVDHYAKTGEYHIPKKEYDKLYSK